MLIDDTSVWSYDDTRGTGRGSLHQHRGVVRDWEDAKTGPSAVAPASTGGTGGETGPSTSTLGVAGYASVFFLGKFACPQKFEKGVFSMA